jgi:hypothetical protein
MIHNPWVVTEAPTLIKFSDFSGTSSCENKPAPNEGGFSVDIKSKK